MKGKDCVTPEKAMEFALKYGCPYEFGFKTEYMDKWCPDGYRQGNCEICWDSEVIENNFKKTDKQYSTWQQYQDVKLMCPKCGSMFLAKEINPGEFVKACNKCNVEMVRVDQW